MRKPSVAARGVRAVTLALTATALVRELRTPRAERTWHGVVAGFVPYDFRAPRPDRIRVRLWAPHDPRLVTPTVFGLGWTVNLGRVVALARETIRTSRSK